MKKTFYILIIGFVFSGCIHKSLNPGDYVRWIKNKKNGLLKEKEIDDYVFSIQYKPLEYVALLEQKSKEIFDKKQYESDLKEMSGLDHYTFSIRTKEKGNPLTQGISNEKEGFEREDYFSYRLGNDLMIVEGNDTVKCAFCHFERTYELSPQITFIVGFEKKVPKKATDKQFIYRDRLLGTGTVKMVIKHSAIKRLPSLKTN